MFDVWCTDSIQSPRNCNGTKVHQLNRQSCKGLPLVGLTDNLTHHAMKNLDLFALIWFGGFSVIAFLAFGFDKWRAAGTSRRISESTLAWLGALGGWPGGLIGMNLFRHKTMKWTFKLKYALALIPFAAEIWAWLHWR
jgi:uncharacterized membrane protein YsdA (DUF1294 family)